MNSRWYLSGDALLRQIRQTRLPDNALAFWYLGQMGILVKYRDELAAFDVLLSDLRRADGSVGATNYQPPFEAGALRGLTVFFGSHDHADHINTQTLIPLQKSNPDMKVIIPEGVRRNVLARGLAAQGVIGAVAGQEIEPARDICALPIPSAHETYDTDENGHNLFLGYAVKIGPFFVYHSGDTVLTERLISDVRAASLRAHVPGPDVEFLPVNGADLPRHRRHIVGNMDERSAAFLAQETNADLVVPLHYDLVPGNTVNPLVFASVMDEEYPGRKYGIYRLGERVILWK